MSNYTRFTFKARTGYVIAPGEPGAPEDLVAVGHTAHLPPWSDPDIHLHTDSEEFYFLLRGELQLLVAGSLVSLRPREILMLNPHVPHAIVGGTGPVEHFGIRAPAIKDKRPVGEIPSRLPPLVKEEKRELRCDWGCRIPLEAARNQNCWLIGMGTARFKSSHLILAYLNFPTVEAANAGIGTRHRPHLHQRSWECYAVIEGTKRLQVENEMVTVEAGEILVVPPRVCHTLHGRQAPYRGFTLRVPILEADDKVEC